MAEREGKKKSWERGKEERLGGRGGRKAKGREGLMGDRKEKRNEGSKEGKE